MRAEHLGFADTLPEGAHYEMPRYGAGLIAVLNSVSARLDTRSLRVLDALVEMRGQDPRQVADSWLRAHGLIPGGVVR